MTDERATMQPQPLDPETQAFANSIRGATFELLSIHEAEMHGGEPCGYQRLSHVAWIAHSLGVGSAHFEKLKDAIAMYEAGCPCGVPTLLPEHFAGHAAPGQDDEGAFDFDDVIDLGKWTETTSINFLCDDCRVGGRLNTLTTGLANQAAAEGFARDRGWRLEEGKWRCPAHAQTIVICHWPACLITTAHLHCRECGSTGHDVAHCDKLG
jgi:hypothetical protein